MNNNNDNNNKITYWRAAIRIYCIKTYMAVVLPGFRMCI